MCCSARQHVQIIAIISICVSIVSAGSTIILLKTFNLNVSTEFPDTTDGENNVAASKIILVMSIYVTKIAIDILCFIGANKSWKFWLIPFMVLTSSEVLLLFIAFVGLSIYGPFISNIRLKIASFALVGIFAVAKFYFLAMIMKLFHQLPTPATDIGSGESTYPIHWPYRKEEGTVLNQPNSPSPPKRRLLKDKSEIHVIKGKLYIV